MRLDCAENVLWTGFAALGRKYNSKSRSVAKSYIPREQMFNVKSLQIFSCRQISFASHFESILYVNPQSNPVSPWHFIENDGTVIAI